MRPAGRLNSRLASLERRLAPPALECCAACGLPLPGAKPGPVTFTVGWWGEGDPEEPPCPACGRRSVFRIEFDRAG